MKRRAWFALVCAATFAGCAGQFKSPHPSADYGLPPKNYEAAIRAHFDQVLKDPESVRFRFNSPPRRAYVNAGLIYGGDVQWLGYMMDIEVNAKNSYGGYVGFKPYMVFFDGESVRRVIDGSSHPLVHRID